MEGAYIKTELTLVEEAKLQASESERRVEETRKPGLTRLPGERVLCALFAVILALTHRSSPTLEEPHCQALRDWSD